MRSAWGLITLATFFAGLVVGLSAPRAPEPCLLSCDPGETLYSYTSTHGPTLACRRSTEAPPTWRPLR